MQLEATSACSITVTWEDDQGAAEAVQQAYQFISNMYWYTPGGSLKNGSLHFSLFFCTVTTEVREWYYRRNAKGFFS